MTNNSETSMESGDSAEVSEERRALTPDVTSFLPSKPPGSVSGLAQHVNRQIAVQRSSPLEPLAQRLVPWLRKFRADSYAFFRRPKRIRSLSELMREPIRQQWVSIDFFDTLVIRHVEPPDYVLKKVAEISVEAINRRTGLILTEADYLHARRSCEHALRRENQKYHGQDGEALLPAVLERMLRQFNAGDAELLNTLLELEVGLESDALSLNESAAELLRYLQSENKKVVVLSDMYLPPACLRDFSKRLGIGDCIDRFHVSGESGLAKHSGRLFEHVLAENGLAAAEILHIGDHVHSDYSVPARLGIDARWLYDPSRWKKKIQIGRKLRHRPENFMRRIIEERSQSLYQPAEELDRTLFQHLSPAVFCMAYQSLRACVSLGIGRLYFLAREGITLRRVFRCLVDNHPEFAPYDFQFRTLYCSRSSTVCGQLDPSGDADQLISMVAERSSDFSIDGLFAAWNVSGSASEFGIGNPPVISSREELLDFLREHPEFCNELIHGISVERDLLIRYLDQQGVTDGPCAFVDVGWSGTIQRNVQALGLGTQIYGMYIGTNDKFEANNLRGLVFSSSDYRAGAIHKSAGLTETLLSVSDLPTTIGYEVKEGEIQPVFGGNTESNHSIAPVRDRVLNDFYPVFRDLTRKYCIPTPVLTEHARQQYFDLVRRPSRAFLKAAATLEFNFDWGREQASPLVSRISLGDYLRPRRTLSALWYSPWLFGTLKASYLGVLNRPLSWVLGHEGLINREKLKKRAGFLRKS